MRSFQLCGSQLEPERARRRSGDSAFNGTIGLYAVRKPRQITNLPSLTCP
jgi:hypothetical protein